MFEQDLKKMQGLTNAALHCSVYTLLTMCDLHTHAG